MKPGQIYLVVLSAPRRRGRATQLASPPIVVPPATAPPSSAAERRIRLGVLRDGSRSCARCPQLVAARNTVVYGAGDPDADVLFVGESPGLHEDRQGLPLVGAAGRLLTELLAEVGLRRDDAYVTTVLKCRPPSNRDPLAEELAHCRSHLHDQVALVRPTVVCTLGNFATKLLREDPAGIKAVRGTVELRTLGTRTVRLLPVHHPDAALYQRSHVELLRHDLALLPGLIAQGEPPQPEPVRAAEAPGDDRFADPAATGAPGGAGSGRGGGAPDPEGPGDQLGLF